MSKLAEIESAVTQLPRPEQAELLRFVATRLRETASDETDYLMSSPANREHLLRAVEDLAAGRNIVDQLSYLSLAYENIIVEATPDDAWRATHPFAVLGGLGN